MRGTGLIERRQFIRAAGAAFVASLAPSAAFALSQAEAVFATGLRHPDGRFAIGLLTERGDFISEISLPGRIHGLCVSRVAGLAVAFARRPGTFAVIFDPNGLMTARIISAPEGRHFFGHGSFSPDGRLLYASENDFDANRGMIGIYDATNGFARIGEVPAHGIGTHDMTVSDDGKLLLIANGGIETHPDFGRTKLNLDHMEPSLVIADAATGSVIQKHSLPEALRQLSTRHLALADNGRIWFACQYEGPRNERPPLVGYFARGEDLTLVDLPDETTDRMGNYVGAIAVNNALGLVGLSSPSKGLSITLDGRTGSLLEERVLMDAAGIAASAQGFAVSSYRGDFADRRHDLAFDQHIMRL